MNLTDYSWSMVQSITQRDPNEIKLIVDNDSEYSRIESDEKGYVLKVAAPRIEKPGLLFSLHGRFFDNDKAGRASLWRMFRTSLCHLSFHSMVTDNSIYDSLLLTSEKTGSSKNTIFAISLVEDYVLEAFLRARWFGVAYDLANANYECSLLMKNIPRESDVGTKIAGNLLCELLVGAPIVRVNREVDRRVADIHSQLRSMEEDIFKSLTDTSENAFSQLKQFQNRKIGMAEEVMKLFEDEGAYLASVPFLPYGEALDSTNSLFEKFLIMSEETRFSLTDSMKQLSIDSFDDRKKAIDERILSSESENILWDFEYRASRRKRIIESYSSKKASHFENILFPVEDYSEFVRTRSKLSNSISRVIERLAIINHSMMEVEGKQSGYLDLQNAIQIIASENLRNDVFWRDEPLRKSLAWAIVIDASKSLENMCGEVRNVAVSLAEVANQIVRNQSAWGCYAFNENLYILKDFDEPYSRATKGRIGSLSIGVQTLLPDALRFANARLQQTTEEVKIILLASDGYPLGYEGIEKDLVETVSEIYRSGTILIGLGIGSSLIQKYFRSNCVINSQYDLMNNFANIYANLAESF